MKPLRILEALGVPLALAALGYAAFPLTSALIFSLGREYAVTDVMHIPRIVLGATASGLVAGIAALVTQRRKTGGQRWAFYGLLALSMPLGAAAICAIEAVRPRGMGTSFGVLPAAPHLSSVPLWILIAGFWVPFLLLLRRQQPRHAMLPAPATPEHRR